MAPVTRQGPNAPPNDTNPNNMTLESVQAMIDQDLLRNSTNKDGSHSSHEDNRKNVKFATCTLLYADLTWWNSQIRSLGPDAYAMTCGIPDNSFGSVKSSKPKTLDETIELANDFMDRKLRTYAKRQTNNKRKADDSSRNNHGHQQQPDKRQNVAKDTLLATTEVPKPNVANAQRDKRANPKGNDLLKSKDPQMVSEPGFDPKTRRVAHVSNNVLRRATADYEILVICKGDGGGVTGVGEGGVASNKGVSTPENPLPVLLMLENTFWVRAEDVYLMILLIEKKIPLTRFTLEQMLNNVRLKVEEESEMSLELLRVAYVSNNMLRRAIVDCEILAAYEACCGGALKLMLLKTSRKYAKGLPLLVEDLMLLVQVKVVRQK
nr:hypothetical protein [Tanacetum cinerariifolium]